MSESSAVSALHVSYDGDSWLAMDADGNYITLLTEDSLALPELPDGSLVSTLLLPVESVLCRTFSLPLSHPRFIDQDILAQELEEHTAEQVEDWWLAWQAGHDENGVSGLMFGLPETLRAQVDGGEVWRQVQTMGVDIWHRLNAQLRAALASRSDQLAQAEGSVAVFDVDASGVFFGIWSNASSGKAENNGYWHGMRRLNWSESAEVDQPWSAMAENIKRSLQAMGWHQKVTESGAIATGRLIPQLLAALALPVWQGESVEAAHLVSRHHANLALPLTAELNFRHGRWRSQAGFGQLKPWYRSMAIAATLALVWAGGMMWQNYQLETQLAAAQQRVIASFHMGLPNEKVMIDALAQLRKAAGGAVGGQHKNSAMLWLQQVDSVQKAYQQVAWQIKSLSLEHGHISMAGRVNDLQAMNKIREILQQQTGRDVKVRDTDLSGKQIQFRLTW